MHKALTFFLGCFLQIEGAFVQGIGFFMLEEYLSNSDGLVIPEGTWTYKIPTIDTIPRQFNVEIMNSGHHKKRLLSSKGIFLFIASLINKVKEHTYLYSKVTFVF